MRYVLAFIILLASTGTAFARDPVKLVYFDNFAPYSWKEDNRMKGVLIDVVNEVIQTEMGIPVIHEGYPWKRAQKLVETNRADAFITVPTPRRKEYTVISQEPISAITLTVFTNRNNRKIEEIRKIRTLSDLKAFTTVCYIGNGWAKKNLKNMSVHWVPTFDEALFLLFSNRYDLYVGGARTVLFNIKRLGYENEIIRIPATLDSARLHLCIGMNSPQVSILADFDAALKEMRESGKLQEINQRYE